MTTPIPRRLPNAMRIEITSRPEGSGWSAYATAYDINDAGAPPVQPLPPVGASSKELAESAAYRQFREWVNHLWPRRTVPDPV
ncbi:MAG: hypothetical protein V4505_11070 [Pseudomonadota bacterium]